MILLKIFKTLIGIFLSQSCLVLHFSTAFELINEILA